MSEQPKPFKLFVARQVDLIVSRHGNVVQLDESKSHAWKLLIAVAVVFAVISALILSAFGSNRGLAEFVYSGAFTVVPTFLVWVTLVVRHVRVRLDMDAQTIELRLRCLGYKTTLQTWKLSHWILCRRRIIESIEDRDEQLGDALIAGLFGLMGTMRSLLTQESKTRMRRKATLALAQRNHPDKVIHLAAMNPTHLNRVLKKVARLFPDAIEATD